MCSPQAGRIGLGIGTLGLSEAVRPALSKTWQNNIDQAGALGLAGPMLKPLLGGSNSPQPVQQYQPQQFQPAPVSAPLFQTAPQFAPRVRANVPGAEAETSSQPRTIK